MPYNYAKAHALTAFSYFNSEDLDIDHKMALRHAKLAASGGELNAQRLLSFMYGKGDQVPVSFQLQKFWAEKAAEQGDAEAHYFLGQMYYRGERTEYNLDKAKSHYQRAYLLGELQGKVDLGEIKQGILRQVREQDVIDLELAAARNNREAQWQLAKIHREAHAPEIDWIEVYWLTRTAELKHPQAVARLIRIKYVERPTPKSNVPLS